MKGVWAETVDTAAWRESLEVMSHTLCLYEISTRK